MPDSFPDRIVAPLFPLPGVVLFPGCLMPLRVFEPRYRKMLEDAMNTEKLIGMAYLRANSADAPGAAGTESDEASPSIHGVLGVGLVVAHTPQADGTINIALLGQARCRIEEELPHQPYRIARVSPLRDQFPETPALQADLLRSGQELLALAQPLIGLTLEQATADKLLKVLREQPAPGCNADLLASLYVHAPELKQTLLETQDVLKRTQVVTAIFKDLLAEIRRKKPQAPYGSSDYSLN